MGVGVNRHCCVCESMVVSVLKMTFAAMLIVVVFLTLVGRWRNSQLICADVIAARN